MIKKNIFYSLLINLLNLGYPLISFTYVARILNPEGIGVFNYALSIVGYFFVFSNLGIPRIAPVEIGRVKDNEAKLKLKINGYYSLNIITSSIVLFAYLILVLCFTDYKSSLQTLLFIFSIQIISNCVGLDWLMQGMLHFKQLVVRDLLVKIGSLVLLFMLIKSKTDILVYGLLYIFSTFISSLVNYIYLKNKYKISFGIHYIKKNIDLRQLVVKVFPISILTTIYLFFDTTLAGYFLPMREVGLYSFAIKIIRIFLLIFDSIFVVLTPVLAHKIANTEKIRELNSTFNIVISNLFGLFLPLSLVILLFSNSIVYFLGGINFIDSAFYLKCLVPMSFFYIYSSIIGSQLLYNIGKLNAIRNILFFVLLVSILLGLFIINIYKILGVIIIINFAFLLLSVLYYYYATKFIKGIVLFSFKNTYKYILSAFIPYFLFCFFIKYISDQNIIVNTVLVITYLLAYIFFLIVFKEKQFTTHISFVLNKIKK